MADIQLPGKGPVEGYKTGTEGSLAAAAAPWNALGGLGHELADLGEDASRTIVQLQRVENHRKADEVQLAADQMFDGFRDRMLKNPGSYSSWLGDWTKERDAFIKANVTDDLAPEQKMMIGGRLAQWSQRSASEVMQHATTMTISQAKLATGNIVDRAYKTGDYDLGANAIKEAPYMTDAEREASILEYDEKFETSQVAQAAEENPKATLEALKEKNEDGTWKNFQNLDPASRNRATSIAESNYQRGTFADIERFNNGLLDGTISRPEQIKKKFPNVSAALQRRMEQDVLRELTDADRKRMATPEYQQGVIGKVAGMLDDYKVEMDDFDEQFYAMDQMVRTLPEGPAKARLNFRMQKVRDNQVDEWKDKADEIRSKFAAARKAGSFGSPFRRESIQSIIDRGFLSDTVKLKKAGLSDAQITAVASWGLPDDYVKAMGWKRPGKDDLVKLGIPEKKAQEIVKSGGQAAQIEAFRELYGHRTGLVDPSLDSETDETMAAILSNAKGYVDTPDQKAEDEVDRKYGVAVDTFEKWYRINPQADDKLLYQKFYSLLSPDGRQKFSESIIPPLSDEGFGVLPPLPNDE